jgi:hypothetical protein
MVKQYIDFLVEENQQILCTGLQGIAPKKATQKTAKKGPHNFFIIAVLHS